MKITQKKLNSFNSGKTPSGNENWNKEHNIPSALEYSYMRLVESALYGIFGYERDLTMKDLRDYIPYTDAQKELAIMFKKQNKTKQS